MAKTATATATAAKPAPAAAAVAAAAKTGATAQRKRKAVDPAPASPVPADNAKATAKVPRVAAPTAPPAKTTKADKADKADKAAKVAPAAKSATPSTAAKPTASKSAKGKSVTAKAPAAAAAGKKAVVAAPPTPQDDDEEEEEEDEEEEDEESSDEDEEDAKANRDAAILETAKLPSSKDDAAVRARLDKVKKEKGRSKDKEIPGVLYVGRLPHGFFEPQLRAYFSQFGTVTHLRLSRNRSTGAPKHYAFIEFADRDVARIVQETMDNYLLSGHLIQVREVPAERVHEKMWVGAGRAFRPVPRDRLQRLRHDAPKTDEQKAKVEANLLKRQSKRRAALQAAGIEYEYEGYARGAEGGAREGE